MTRKPKVYGYVYGGPPDAEGKERFMLFWKGTGEVKWRGQCFRAVRSNYPAVIWKKTEEEAKAAGWKGRKEADARK